MSYGRMGIGPDSRCGTALAQLSARTVVGIIPIENLVVTDAAQRIAAQLRPPCTSECRPADAATSSTARRPPAVGAARQPKCGSQLQRLVRRRPAEAEPGRSLRGRRPEAQLRVER